MSALAWRVQGTLVPWANSSVGILSGPVLPRRHDVRPDPTACGMSGFLGSTMACRHKFQVVESKTQTYHRRVERDARRGRAGQDAEKKSRRSQISIVFPRHQKKSLLNMFPEARTKKNYVDQ